MNLIKKILLSSIYYTLTVFSINAENSKNNQSNSILQDYTQWEQVKPLITADNFISLSKIGNNNDMFAIQQAQMQTFNSIKNEYTNRSQHNVLDHLVIRQLFNDGKIGKTIIITIPAFLNPYFYQNLDNLAYLRNGEIATKLPILNSANRGTFFDFLENLAGSETDSGFGKPNASLVKNDLAVFNNNTSTTKDYGTPIKNDGVSIVNSLGYSGKWQFGEALLQEIGLYTNDTTTFSTRDFNGINTTSTATVKTSAWTATALKLMGVGTALVKAVAPATVDKTLITSMEDGASQTLLNNQHILNLKDADNPLIGHETALFSEKYKSIFLGGRKDFTDTDTQIDYVMTKEQYKAAIDVQSYAVQAGMINNWNRYIAPQTELLKLVGKVFTTTVSKDGYGLKVGDTHSFVLTESGILAGCHILGCTSVTNFLKNAIETNGRYSVSGDYNPDDGNLDLSQYLALHSGFETPIGQKFFTDGTINSDATTKDGFKLSFGDYFSTDVDSPFNQTKSDITNYYTVNKDGSYDALSYYVAEKGTKGVFVPLYKEGNASTISATIPTSTVGSVNNDYIIDDTNKFYVVHNSGKSQDITYSNIKDYQMNSMPINIKNFDSTTSYNRVIVYSIADPDPKAAAGATILKAVDATTVTSITQLAGAIGTNVSYYITKDTVANINTKNAINNEYILKVDYTNTNITDNGATVLALIKGSFNTTDPATTLIKDGGAKNDIIYGSLGAQNTIYGNSGNDYLIGGTNIDKLIDGTGTDFLEGGLGADTFLFSFDRKMDYINDFSIAENDLIDLGIMGRPLLKEISVVKNVNSPNLATNNYTVSFNTYGKRNVFNITMKKGEVLDASSFLDRVVLTKPVNTVTDIKTADYTKSYTTNSEGKDLIYNGSGSTAKLNITGENYYNNSITGGNADDTLIGGSLDDILSDGSKGNDYLTGGMGADIFRLSQDKQKDYITDFNAYEDFIDVSSFGLGKLNVDSFTLTTVNEATNTYDLAFANNSLDIISITVTDGVKMTEEILLDSLISDIN